MERTDLKTRMIIIPWMAIRVWTVNLCNRIKRDPYLVHIMAQREVPFAGEIQTK
jgi:hypothetical protein